MVEIVNVVDVESELAGKQLGIERGILGSRVAGQPGEVGESKGRFLFGGSPWIAGRRLG